MIPECLEGTCKSIILDPHVESDCSLAIAVLSEISIFLSLKF